jgi:hypothetical protein
MEVLCETPFQEENQNKYEKRYYERYSISDITMSH